MTKTNNISTLGIYIQLPECCWTKKGYMRNNELTKVYENLRWSMRENLETKLEQIGCNPVHWSGGQIDFEFDPSVVTPEDIENQINKVVSFYWEPELVEATIVNRQLSFDELVLGHYQ